MPVDHAAYEYSAKPGNRIRWLAFQADMNHLPMLGDGDLLLAPVHCWFYRDHEAGAHAIAHRNTHDGVYEVTSNYFTDLGGWDSHMDVPQDEFRWRWLGTADGWVGQALAQDGDKETHRLGEVFGPPEETFEHVDVMAEIQYSGSMDLPFVDTDDNRVILDWVGTNDGVLRPIDALELNGSQDGEYARITQGTDGWGRFWFGMGVEP